MKKFLSTYYLDLLFIGTVTVLLFAVLFTFVAGESPLEAMGIHPIHGTLGFGVVVLALLVIPVVAKRRRKNA